jgi:hypothetical protein
MKYEQDLFKLILMDGIWMHNKPVPLIQCCGSGSVKIQIFLSDPDPELEVLDTNPELDLAKSPQNPEPDPELL